MECNSDDHFYGKQDTAEKCAEKCAENEDCRFFIFGTNGTKVGDCYHEDTHSASCAEGWEDDVFDFYELKAPWIGCTDPQARNYDPKYKMADNSCTERNPCVEGNYDMSVPGACQKWRNGGGDQCNGCGPIDTGNNGYRNKPNDTVHAARVPSGTIKVDGDLTDWEGHNLAWRYRDVAFADTIGREVLFESEARLPACFGEYTSEGRATAPFGPWFDPRRWIFHANEERYYVDLGKEKRRARMRLKEMREVCGTHIQLRRVLRSVPGFL